MEKQGGIYARYSPGRDRDQTSTIEAQVVRLTQVALNPDLIGTESTVSASARDAHKEHKPSYTSAHRGCSRQTKSPWNSTGLKSETFSASFIQMVDWRHSDDRCRRFRACGST